MTLALSTVQNLCVFVGSEEGGRSIARRLSASLNTAGYGTITTEIIDASGVLLRRKLPSAVPAKPEWVLWFRWNEVCPAIDVSAVEGAS